MKWIMVYCVVAVFGTLLTLGGTASSQDGNEEWSPPLLMGGGWWQTIMTDIEGGTHLVWYGGVNTPDNVGHDVLDYAYLPLNGQWTQRNDVLFTGFVGYTVRNAITTTSDGLLHVVFRVGTQHFVSEAPIQSATNAAYWSPGVAISDTGYYVDMIADRHDTLHLVFSGRVAGDPTVDTNVNAEASPCALCFDLFYRRSTDDGKTWSAPLPLSHDPTTGADRPNIFEGESGRLYIEWDEGVDWNVGKGRSKDVRFVYSDDRGLTWSTPIILDGGKKNDAAPIQIEVAEMRNQELMAVWRYSNDIDPHIYYQISKDSGVSWSEPTAIEGMVARSLSETPLDDYKLITDKLGVVHLFAVGQANVSDLLTVNPTLYHIAFQQGIWSPPYPVFFNLEMRPEWPKASVGIQNDIHLSWFVRYTPQNAVAQLRGYSDNLRVYYSHLAGGLPLQATPTFEPIVTLAPTPTVFQFIVPTDTAFPTFESYHSQRVGSTIDTYAINMLLGGIALAALFCVGVIVVVRLWQR